MIHRITDRAEFKDPYALTIYKTKDRGACKTFSRGKGGEIVTKGYGSGWEFSALVRKVDTFADLAELLTKLANRHEYFIMRGAPSPECDLSAARRTLKRDDLGLVEVDRAWVMFDYDKERKEGWPDIVKHPEQAAETLVDMLPSVFHDIPFWWQVGASCGIKEDKYSMHLWCLLDQPIPRKTLSKLIHAHGFDRSTAIPNLPHYIANPILINVKDQMKVRYGVINA